MVTNDYYIQISTWGSDTPNIIDADTMENAELGLNYLNPEDFDYLCEADCIHDAEEFYFEEQRRSIFDAYAEQFHY